MIQTRLHYLVEAIASGRSTGKVFDSLNEVEARRKVVVQELSTRDSLDQTVSLDAKRLTKDLRSRLGDIPALFARTYRRRVRCSESSWMDISCVNQLWKRGGRVIVSRQPGRLDRLLTGMKVINDGGRGQAIQPSLGSLLRFEVQGVALVA